MDRALRKVPDTMNFQASVSMLLKHLELKSSFQPADQALSTLTQNAQEVSNPTHIVQGPLLLTRVCRASPHSASLLVANVPAPASQCLDDFRRNCGCKWNPEEYERLVHSICQEQLSPYACNDPVSQ